MRARRLAELEEERSSHEARLSHRHLMAQEGAQKALVEHLRNAGNQLSGAREKTARQLAELKERAIEAEVALKELHASGRTMREQLVALRKMQHRVGASATEVAGAAIRAAELSTPTPELALAYAAILAYAQGSGHGGEKRSLDHGAMEDQRPWRSGIDDRKTHHPNTGSTVNRRPF